eukprot:TRINITY_DN40115_c0_g1_i1.p1 TRINITY_DN40115_c0_g1~~TRINITY_DN40115_c0_g1_i1.p1  ORF type:complete len:499 (+),score=103.87 TRINITY_DN40115_c0_g1_i1:82-1578(+)
MAATTVFVGGVRRAVKTRDAECDAKETARLVKFFSAFGQFCHDDPPRAFVHRGFALVPYTTAEAAAAAVAAVAEAGADGVCDAEGLLCRHAEIAKPKPEPKPAPPAPTPPPPPTINEDWAAANLVLAVVKSHASRVAQYVGSPECASRLSCGDLRVLEGAAVGATKGDQQHQMEIGFVHAADPCRAAAALVTDSTLSRAVRRVFVVEPELWQPDCESAMSALQKLLSDTAARMQSERKVGVRLQTFPTGILRRVVDKLGDESGPWELNPQSGELVASVVQTRDGFRVGVSGRDTFANDMTVLSAVDCPVSRAYYKLKEAVDRSGAVREFDFGGAFAVDAGAAPGGWTKYLAEMGCARVYAVDPAVLELSPMPAGVRHMKCKIQEALPEIAADAAAVGRVLDVFVSDLCPHEEDELLSVVKPLLEGTLVRPGGLVVLTFKLTHGHSVSTWDKMAREQAACLDRYLQPGRTRLLHLMANRTRERTLVGYARGSAPDATAA